MISGSDNLEKLTKIASTTPFGPSIVGAPASNYGITKYLEVFYAAELARREPNITAVSLHPGVVSTDMTGIWNHQITPSPPWSPPPSSNKIDENCSKTKLNGWKAIS